MRACTPTRTLLSLAALVSLGCSATAKGGLLPLPGHTLVSVPVKSFADLRFKNVVRQASDLSCGAASLATILNYYYDDPTSERAVIDAMLDLGDKEKILKDGFSLLELKKFAEREGYTSAGYRLESIEQLARVQVPVITLVNVRGYAHFVVIKGVVGGQVHVADPAFGNRTSSLKRFDKEWNKVILAVLSPTRSGNSAFMEDGALGARPGEVMLLIDRVRPSITPGFGEFKLR